MDNEGRSSDDFGKAFGDALSKFLLVKGLTPSGVSELLALGTGGKARLNTYLHDSRAGTRPKPSAEVLYKLCTQLGFEFEYNGYKISAVTVNGNRPTPSATPAEQLPLEFNRQFDLTEGRGTVSVRVKRPLGRIEVRLALKAAS